MPACTVETVAKVWPRERIGSGRARPGSQSSTSSGPSSPELSRVITLRPDSPIDKSSPILDANSSPEVRILGRVLGWYPAVLLRFIRHLISTVIYLTWSQFLLFGPTILVSVWLWIFWKLVQYPLSIIKWFVSVFHTPVWERARRKRTVLISGGSSIQTVHLARNFYCAGARVIVCEVDGLFGLTRFSVAVHKFYSVPRPEDKPQDYVRALCDIVEKESVAYYIPVSSSTSAYYDAIAKPHLETLGCCTFCPNVKEIWILDDFHEILARTREEGLPFPLYYRISSKKHLISLYDCGLLREGRHFMSSVGLFGVRNKYEVILPNSQDEFLQRRFQYEISELRPWVVVQDLSGEHFITCTTVKESQVVANVTCRVEECGKLIPTKHPEILNWVKKFLQKLNRSINGHLAFKFVVTEVSGSLVPLGCRVGVSLPYICHNSLHPRTVWKPCRHFVQSIANTPMVGNEEHYWMHETVLNVLRNPSVNSFNTLVQTVLEKREALFVFWDPLPYCAYYHFQLPFRNMLALVHGQYELQNCRNGYVRTS